MLVPVKISLPKWAFEAAFEISKLRSPCFQNRFENKKIRKLHENEAYCDFVESIIGYLGDIACAVFLGISPKCMLKEMVYSTDCLTHRDKYDLFFNSCNIDIKIEDYGTYQEKVLNNTIRTDEPYGCRLINKSQWIENSNHIDFYIFGTFDHAFSDKFKLHNAKNINLLGFVSHNDIKDLPFSKYTPAGKKLLTEAKIIPHSSLKNINLLKTIINCGREIQRSDFTINKPECIKIIQKLETIWLNKVS